MTPAQEIEWVASAIGNVRRLRVAAGVSRECRAADLAYATAAVYALAQRRLSEKEEESPCPSGRVERSV